MNRKILLLSGIIIILGFTIVWKIQCNDKSKLDQILTPLPSSFPLRFPDEVFNNLNITDNIKIIGVGEATHGTAEFMELKHRMFRYLVERKGFRALVKEINYMKSLLINDYIWYGKGNIDSVLSDLGWIHSNNEAIGVINWMLDYNKGKPDNEKLYFIGIDSQLDMWEMNLHFNYIRNYDNGLYVLISKYEKKLLQLGKPDYAIMTTDEYHSIMQTIDSLLVTTKLFFIKNPEKSRQAQILRLMQGLRYSHKFLYYIYRGKESVNYREDHLCESALGVWDIIDDSSGYLLWAHNAHIAVNPLYSNGQGSLGWLLKQKMLQSYYPVGISFARGSFIALNSDPEGNDTPPRMNTIESPPPENSVNYILCQEEIDNFIINFKRNKDNKPLRTVFDKVLPFIDIGDIYLGDADIHYSCEYDGCMNVWQSFNALFFFKETRPVSFE